MAIEQRMKETLEEQFAGELKDGTLVSRVIDISQPENEALADKYQVTWSSLYLDISQPENEALADKYQVTWSSLYLCRWRDGKETSENLTEFAFGNARKAPEAFKAGLAARIRELQK